MDASAMLCHARAIVVTMGERGSEILTPDRALAIPAVPPRQVVDPTGVGDAYRGGFLKGLALGAGFEVCGRMGSVAAAYALEHLGGTSHSYTREEFMERYREAFGDET
jgi:adenosine kinase